MRLIDADEFIKEMNNRCESAIKWGINAIADHNEEIKTRAEQAVATFCEASLTAKKMPTIESDPVKHGRWIKIGEIDKDGNQYYQCSKCGKGEIHVPIIDVKYCWNCGAMMDEEADHDDHL